MKFVVLKSLMLGMILLLGGCSNLREDLGLGRNAPDEFAVVDRPPLAMPPEFALRPPKPNAPRPQEVDPSSRAKDALFNDNVPSTPVPTDASDIEKELLIATGADKADPNIRDMVDRETTQKVVADDHLVEELLTWTHGKSNEPVAAVVDATGEAARISTVKSKGEPLNTGATPIIERDKSGWLGL